jgi:hypothetical protein
VKGRFAAEDFPVGIAVAKGRKANVSLADEHIIKTIKK